MSDQSQLTPGDSTVAAVGERALIARVRARAGRAPAWTVVGIGDDAAVVEPGRGQLDVITTDSLVEDVHFRRAWSSAQSIGRKAVAINLSNLAAMGATPRALVLNLLLPPTLPLEDFDALIDGVVEEAATAGAALVGGDIARSPGPLALSLTAIGVAGRRRVLTRSGARPGDELYVTGSIGAAAAGLAILESGASRTGLDAAQTECLQRFDLPVARLRCGRAVAAYRGASACMDLSDGLADAVHQVAQASGTGAVVEADALPIHSGAQAWFAGHGIDVVAAAVTGGEDYELLFAVPPRRRRAFFGAMSRSAPLTATRIGRLTAEPGVKLHRQGAEPGPLPAGFAHFGGDSRSLRG